MDFSAFRKIIIDFRNKKIDRKTFIERWLIEQKNKELRRENTLD